LVSTTWERSTASSLPRSEASLVVPGAGTACLLSDHPRRRALGEGNGRRRRRLAQSDCARKNCLPSREEEKDMAGVGRPSESLDDQVRRVTAAIKNGNGLEASDDVIEQTVRECFAEREDARIQDFVSLLAERSARERLRRLAGTERDRVAT
jgi:hypothetical protein